MAMNISCKFEKASYNTFFVRAVTVKSLYTLRRRHPVDTTKKNFIPKDEYYQLVEEVKAVSQQTNLKTRHEYYLLAK